METLTLVKITADLNTEPTDYEQACDKALNTACAAFGRTIMDPQEYLWGMRHFVNTDPSSPDYQCGHLDWNAVVDAACEAAEHLAESHPEGHGFGSSDKSCELIAFMQSIGFLIGNIDGRFPVIGRKTYRVGWQTSTDREDLAFFGPVPNHRAGWNLIGKWRESERQSRNLKPWEQFPGMFDVQVLSDTSHRYPGFENVEITRW